MVLKHHKIIKKEVMSSTVAGEPKSSRTLNEINQPNSKYNTTIVSKELINIKNIPFEHGVIHESYCIDARKGKHDQKKEVKLEDDEVKESLDFSFHN